MDREIGEMKTDLIEIYIVRGIGTLALVGAAIFLIMAIHSIAIYLAAAGVAFWISSLGWKRRYENVIDVVPEGYRPTGEVYVNPGAGHDVAVYFKGIRRIYVRQDS